LFPDVASGPASVAVKATCRALFSIGTPKLAKVVLAVAPGADEPLSATGRV
jgi:hypothetical protein